MTDLHRIRIGDVEVGDGLPCHLIAEIGLNHNGSVELAHRAIDAAARSGATAVKFQKRSPAALATADFLDAPFEKCPLFGSTQRRVRERLELSLDELGDLKAHADGLGLLFSSSVFDLESLDIVEALDLPFVKIASHSITHGPLLEAAAALGRPVLASLGGADWGERDRAVEILAEVPLVLLHCVSSYPTPDAEAKLDTIGEIRRRYGRPVGFSGHEDGVALSIAAAALGASVIERHFTLDRAMVGLDHGISLEPAEFAELALATRRVAKARGVVEGIAPGEMAARTGYHVAVCAAEPIAAGATIERGHLVCKQPLVDAGRFFTGLEVDQVVGRRARRDLPGDRAIPRDGLE